MKAADETKIEEWYNFHKLDYFDATMPKAFVINAATKRIHDSTYIRLTGDVISFL